MKTRTSIRLLAGFVVLVLAGTVVAVVGPVDESDRTYGATKITWESSFQDLDYTINDVTTFTVNWTVDTGVASYDGFFLRGKEFTPTTRKDPALGELIDATGGTDSVTVQVRFTGLHFDDEDGNVDIGNGHFTLFLMIDIDGDGVPETKKGYGVNIHVEDPQ